jgi:hypothetical protein
MLTLDMDPRFQTLIERQRASGFRGLGGSEVYAAIKLSAELLNETIAALTPATSAVRQLTVRPRAANAIDVRVEVSHPFVPAINVTVVIDRQPQLPDDPVLVLRLTGGAGMLRVIAPAIAKFTVLPPGVRLEGDRLLVDLRAQLQQLGQEALLACAQQLEVATVEGTVVVLLHAAVNA